MNRPTCELVNSEASPYYLAMSRMTHTRLVGRTTLLMVVVGATALLALFRTAQAQPGAQGTVDPSLDESKFSLFSLFWQSADLFTILIVIGSVWAAMIIVRCALEVRSTTILNPDSEHAMRKHLRAGRLDELKRFAKQDTSFAGAVIRAALNAPRRDRQGVHEAAEFAATEEAGRWFRKIEPLNIIGNLGPLLGLAGTVWGMIIAFASLGDTGGRAGPADLSIGISKALFHTLLGLLLAVPALTAFGFYRSYIDKLCTRAMALSAELVEMIPEESASDTES